MGATEANGSDEFFKGSGYAQEYLITKNKNKNGIGRRENFPPPGDIPSHTRPAIPGELLSSRARFRFTG